jgi:hypothetical protein
MSTSDYLFNNMGRIGNDSTDLTQKNVYNMRFNSYMLSNFYNDTLSDSYIKFATSQPTMMASGMVLGNGLSGFETSAESKLLYNPESERPLEKIQLFQRPFITVPYLGRGAGDPTLESQLQQGEIASDKKSVSVLSESSLINYTSRPLFDEQVDRVQNPAYSVEESALNGWVRGGSATRDLPSTYSSNKFNSSY